MYLPGALYNSSVCAIGAKCCSSKNRKRAWILIQNNPNKIKYIFISLMLRSHKKKHNQNANNSYHILLLSLEMWLNWTWNVFIIWFCVHHMIFFSSIFLSIILPCELLIFFCVWSFANFIIYVRGHSYISMPQKCQIQPRNSNIYMDIKYDPHVMWWTQNICYTTHTTSWWYHFSGLWYVSSYITSISLYVCVLLNRILPKE